MDTGQGGRNRDSMAGTVTPVTSVDALLSVYDRQMRGVRNARICRHATSG